MKTFKQLQEVLSKDAEAGEWIDDFIKSDDPKFAGKSKEKRKQMALAAYYAKQNEEVELDESSRVETGQLFKQHLDKAIAASEAGNHTQAKRHLANAQTARYGILAKHIPKHQASFDKYKELKHSYTNSDEPVREETELDEAHKINDKVEIIRGSSKGITGHIGEIRHGAFKGAPKEYTVYHGEHGATRVKKEHIKAIKEGMEEVEIDEVYKQGHAKFHTKTNKQIGPTHYGRDSDKKADSYTKADPRYHEVRPVKEAMTNPGLEALASKVRAARTGKPSNPGLEKAAHEKAKAKHLNKESAEQIDELSNKLLNRYSKKAEKEAGKHFMAADRAQDRGNYDKAQTNMDKAEKRASGVYRAQSKIKEESLDEISADAAEKYYDANHAEKRANASDLGITKNQARKAHNRIVGSNRALDRMYKREKTYKEEVEVLDEISKDTLSSYANKAFAQGNDLHQDLSYMHGNKATDAERKAIRDKISKRNAGVIKASQKMKEDIDEAVDTVKRDEKGKVIAWSHEGDWEKSSTKNGGARGRGKVANLSDVARRKSEKLSNEAVESDKIKRKPIPWAKEHPTDAEQERRHRRDDDDVPHPYVTPPMRKEAVENLDELSKDTLKSYAHKAATDIGFRGMDAGRQSNEPEDKSARTKNFKTMAKRVAGIDKVVHKLTKEDVEPMLTFKELLESISESKIDDLRDKLAIKRAGQSAYDKDYKPAAKSNVQKVKGHSYGAGEEEGDDEDDNNKKLSKPAAPEVKRGRGRPAGSKSGARN